MKNRYDYPPGLFGIGFVAAAYSATPIDVQPKETQPVFDGRGQMIAETQSEPRKSKKFRRGRLSRSGSGTIQRQ